MTDPMFHLNSKVSCNQSGELCVRGDALSCVILSEDAKLPPNSIYFSPIQELTQSVSPSVLLSAPTWNDLSRLEMTIEISNDGVDFFQMNAAHAIVKTADKSKQLYVKEFRFRYFKIRLANISETEETIKSLSYCY